jgi:hypothetical protein
VPSPLAGYGIPQFESGVTFSDSCQESGTENFEIPEGRPL